MRIRRIAVDSVNLEVAEAGEGGLPLLLVHGYGGAKEDFTDFLDALASRGWHAVAPDLRGHGASDYPDNELAYDFDVFAADLLALAGTLGWSTFTLLGHSMGGMVAQHLVLDHPERIAALVLMDTTHGATDWIDPQLAELATVVIREQGVKGYVDLARELRDADPLLTPAFTRLLREREGYEEFCDAKALATAPAMRLSMMPKLLAQADRLEQLAQVRVPALVLVGEEDEAFVPHAERMAKTIPNARLAVIADAGHSPQFENTAAWWEALTSFLDGVMGPA